MLILASADSFAHLMLYAVIQGLSWGTRGPILTAMRGDYFGRRSFAMIMGFSQMVMMVGMIIGPLFTGYMADNFSYSRGFIIIAVAVGVGSLLFLVMKKPQPRTPKITPG